LPTPFVKSTPDGERFLLLKRPDPPATPRIVVVLSWLEELKAKVPPS